MFAQLTYESGATFANVMADISLALTGGDIAAMSASLNKPESTLTNVPGGAATWTEFAASTSFADTNTLTSGVTNQSSKIFSQAASTSFGTQVKYLKLGLVTFSVAPTSVRMAFNIGYGTGNGRPIGGTDHHSIVGTRATTSDTTFNHAIMVQIYSSPTATLINIINSSLFSAKTPVVCFDFPLTTNHMELAGNLCTFVGRGDQLFGTMVATTVGGKQYGLSGGRSNATCKVTLGTPECYDISGNVLSDYKFENFRKTGTKFDLMNFGVTGFDMESHESPSQTWHSQNYFTNQMPFASVTDITEVYLCNAAAFGKSGSFFNTPLGTMCKFGIFMVGV